MNFLKWWVYTAPKRLTTIFGRILILVNNEVSFFLNIKMLFVPLFGDYTWIGRIMGFIYRVAKIVIGLAFVIVLAVFGVLVVFAWYAVPIFISRHWDLWSVLVMVFIFALWRVATRNIPGIRVGKADDKNYLRSFRPETLHYLGFISSNVEEGLTRFFIHKDIKVLLTRLELKDHELIADMKPSISLGKNDIAKSAFGFAKKHKTRYVESEHLFLALLSQLKDSDRVLAKLNLDLKTCEMAVSWILHRRERLSRIFFWQEDFRTPSIGGINRAMTGRITPILDSVSVDMTEQARKGLLRRIMGHKLKATEIIQILENSEGANVMIVGPPGSGKTSIVRGLAQKIIDGEVGPGLRFKRLVAFDAGTLIAGAKTPGDVSETIRKALKDAEGSGNIILFFDEIHNLVLADSGGSNIFSILEPYLASDRFQVLGATSMEDYRKLIEPNPAFSRLFKVVEIGETDEEETTQILERVAFDLEKQYGVMFSYPAVRDTYSLAKKLIHERVFPDKGIDILARTAIKEKNGDKFVSDQDVALVVSNLTNIPVTAIKSDESKKLLGLEEELKKKVVGQDHAIEQVSKAMKRGRVGIRNESKPIAVFLFVGTTGVGKTETARALSEYYFGSQKSMVRLDMSEYQQKDSMTRLIGSPDGSSKGLLTEAVRRRPYALVLLDELEKADPQVLLTFLQVFDDGRLTDPSGRVIDFTNTIIIATSNVGTRSIQGVIEKNGSFDEVQKVAMADVQNHFAPEFLNRFSGIIVYRPLDQHSVFKITKLMLERVARNVESKGIKLSFKPELISEIISRGYDIENGARPLARAIEDSVETYVATKILAGELKSGDEVELGMEVFEKN